MPEHGHITISIPAKYAVSQLVGYIEGKTTIHLPRTFGGAEEAISNPIRNQEQGN